MNIYCIKCSKFTSNNNNIKIRHKFDSLTVFTVVLKSLKLLIKKNKSLWLEKFKLYITQYYYIVWRLEKIYKVKTQWK